MAGLAERIKLGGMLGVARARSPENIRKRVLLEVAYKLHVKEVYGLAFRLLASQSVAEDATVSAYRKFNSQLSRRWNEKLVLKRLRKLVIGEALEILRPRINCEFAAPATLADLSSLAVVGPAARRLDSTTLELLIRLLPDALRVTFVLRDIEGFDTRTVAELLRINEDTTQDLIRRARMRLRQIWRST